MSGNSIITLAFAAMLSWGLSDFLVQKLVRKIGNLETMVWLGIIASALLLPFVWSEFYLLTDLRNLLLLSLLGISVFVMNYFAYLGYRDGKLSVVEVVHTIELPLTILFGLILLKESLSLYQSTLILLMMYGIYLISRRKLTFWDKLKKIFTGLADPWEKGIFFAAVGGIICSLVNFLIAYDALTISPLLTIWFAWTLFAIASLSILFRLGLIDKFIKNSASVKEVILSAGAVDGGAWIFYALVLSQKELSITTAITDSYPAIAMFFGIKYNGEKITFSQYTGAVLALSASIMLGLFY